jgi:hypothetical protein
MKEQIYESAKSQHVAISERECEQIVLIQILCRVWRPLDQRMFALTQAGFYPHHTPAKTGHGVGSCFQRMSNGKLRVRVSHNWSGKFGNYAWVCDI